MGERQYVLYTLCTYTCQVKQLNAHDGKLCFEKPIQNSLSQRLCDIVSVTIGTPDKAMKLTASNRKNGPESEGY